MNDLVAIWGSCFGLGIALSFVAMSISYPFQVFKQGVEQI